jgi:hypothetical protein
VARGAVGPEPGQDVACGQGGESAQRDDAQTMQEIG